jgi:hypothetical protein
MTVSQPIPYISPRATEIAGRIVPLSAVTLDLRARYLVKGWLDRGALSVIYGESNVGKTFLALDLGLHVAAGTAWHGHRVKGGPVVYIACEGGGGIEKRLSAIGQAMPELSACADGKFSLIREMVDLHGEIDAAAITKALGIRGIQNPALIIVDTLARAMGAGDENTAKDMGQFVQSVDAIRQATGAHVAIIHHSGKDAAKGARGSGSLRAAVDTEIELARNGETIVATAKKQRDMPCGAEFAYRLVSVELAIDGDGDAVTSAIVQRADIPARRAAKLSGQALIAMQAFGDALAAHGEIKRGGDFPQNRQCVSLAHWREACDRHHLSNGEGESSARAAFAKTWKTLQEKGAIRVIDGFAWRCDE